MSSVASLRSFQPHRLWQAAFWLCLASVPLQVFLGEAFYKAHIGPLYGTEFFILLAWGMGGAALMATGRLLKVPVIGTLLGLSLIYLLYSLFAYSEWQWVFRQAAFILYLSCAGFSYVMVRHFRDRLDVGRMLNAAGIAGVVAFPFFLVTPWLHGNRDYTATMLFMLGYCYWLVRSRSLARRAVVAALGTAFTGLTSLHSSFMIAPAGVFLLLVLLEYRSLRLPLIALVMVVVVFVVRSDPGYTDYNAMFRYLYWQSVIADSWSRGLFLLGKGFGAPFLPTSSPYYEQIVTQVSDPFNREFQIHTVPPHNCLLTILHFIGLPGVILLFYPWARALKQALQRSIVPHAYTLLLATTGMFVLMLANQSLEVPYVAVPFWLSYGLLIGLAFRRPVAVRRASPAG